MDERGISAVVGAVLLIIITISSAVLVWSIVIPMIRENAAEISQEGVSLSIVTSEGYTVWDGANNFAMVQIKRSNDELNLEGYQVVFFGGDEAHSVIIDKSNLVPNRGQKIVNGFILPQNFIKPTNIRIAPIIDGEIKSVTSEIVLGSQIKDSAKPINLENIAVDLNNKFNGEKGFCVDNDPDKDPSLVGEVYYCTDTKCNTVSDKCASDSLYDYYCNANGIKNKLDSCPYGCDPAKATC